MPFDINGNFTPTKTWATNEDVAVDGLNTASNDFADGLSQTFLRDGSIAMTGNLNANSHKITELTEGSNTKDAVNFGQLSTIINDVTDLANTKLDADKLRVVTTLPSVPEEGVYYFVIGN